MNLQWFQIFFHLLLQYPSEDDRIIYTTVLNLSLPPSLILYVWFFLSHLSNFMPFCAVLHVFMNVEYLCQCVQIQEPEKNSGCLLLPLCFNDCKHFLTLK